MTVKYNATLRDARMDAVISAIDASAGAAYIEICSAAYALVLATITLSDPSFTRLNGVITMAGAPKSDTDADNTGTAAIARIKNGDGTVVVQDLSVGVGTGDIQLNSTSITQHQTVTLTSGTITHSNNT